MKGSIISETNILHKGEYMKRIVLFVLTAIALICILVSCGEKSDFAYEKNKEGEIVITGYNGEEMNVIVPDTINGKTVVAIGEAAFDASKIERIELPETVVEIGRYAFRRCGKLTEVTIKGNVETIEAGTFNFCSVLKKVTLPDTVKTIEDNAFGVSAITEITLPDSLVTLGDMVFYDCRSLKAVKCGKGLEAIGGGCFSGCTSLTDITFNDSLKTIGEMAFAGCGFTSLDIPNGVEVLEPTVFAACTFTEYTVSSGIKTIKRKAFADCKSLKKIYIPENVEKIETDAFSGTKDLVICGVRDSEAEIFADTYGFKFEEYNFE